MSAKDQMSEKITVGLAAACTALELKSKTRRSGTQALDLSAYVSPEDLQLSRPEFLQMVRDRIDADLQALAVDKAPAADQAGPAGDAGMSNDKLRQLWIEAGGAFHGPRVETGTMPEAKLLSFLRKLMRAPDCVYVGEFLPAGAFERDVVFFSSPEAAQKWGEQKQAQGEGVFEFSREKVYDESNVPNDLASEYEYNLDAVRDALGQLAESEKDASTKLATKALCQEVEYLLKYAGNDLCEAVSTRAARELYQRVDAFFAQAQERGLGNDALAYAKGGREHLENFLVVLEEQDDAPSAGGVRP